jgi:hypothetical protein
LAELASLSLLQIRFQSTSFPVAAVVVAAR